MKNKRATQRSFPGRLTLADWLALPGFARRDMISRAACALLHCHRLCAGKACQRHRTCCGDDAAACKERLWQRATWHRMTLRRELCRLGTLAGLGGTDSETSQNTAKSFVWSTGLDDPWHAPEFFPGETQRPAQTGAGPGVGAAEEFRGFGLQSGGKFL
jgi:hypothetical protein